MQNTQPTAEPRKTIIIPQGFGKKYGFQYWFPVTQGEIKLYNKSSDETSYDSEGYARIRDYYVVAVSPVYGMVGDYLYIYCADGRIIHAIIGLKIKDLQLSKDISINPMTSTLNKGLYGYNEGETIVVFLTNWEEDHEEPAGNGGIIKIENYESYFEGSYYDMMRSQGGADTSSGTAASSGSSSSASTSTEYYEPSEPEKTVGTLKLNYDKESINTSILNTVYYESTGQIVLMAGGNDITKNIGGLSWKNSIYELSVQMSFETAKTDNAYLKELIYTPKIGDVVQMITNIEVFRGVVIRVDDGDKFKNKYTAADLGWYLNKTSETYQFREMPASKAIRQICDDMSIPVDSIADIKTTISEIYFDKTISDIFKDILEKCEGSYNYDFTPEGLRIYRIGDLEAYPELRLASNLKQVYAPDYRGSVSHSGSIEDMINSVKVITENDGTYTEVLLRQNKDDIYNYGLLQKVIKIDTEKENAETEAQSILEENGRVKESYSFEIIEKYDSYTRAGEVIPIDGEMYLIESTDHSIKGGVHYNKLELKRI